MPHDRPAVAAIRDPEQASALAHPLRTRILAAAHAPTSAAALARALDQPRQKVNYHVRELLDAGLLERAGSRPARGLTERLVRASADAYVVAPDVLGAAAADEAATRDAFSAARVLALAGRTQSELGRVVDEASRQGRRVPSLSIDATVRFTSAEQRAAFTRALQEAIVEVVRTHTAPAFAPDGSPGEGRPHRLVVAAHPVPPDHEPTGEDADDEGHVLRT